MDGKSTEFLLFKSRVRKTIYMMHRTELNTLDSYELRICVDTRGEKREADWWKEMYLKPRQTWRLGGGCR